MTDLIIFVGIFAGLYSGLSLASFSPPEEFSRHNKRHCLTAGGLIISVCLLSLWAYVVVPYIQSLCGGGV